MSALRLYEDAALTSIVSLDGAFTNPDDESNLDGTAGETSTKALWVAVEQTTLAADMDISQTTVTLTAARFADTGHPVIIIGSEKMLVTAGGGTTTLTVSRGHDSTTKATHDEDDAVYLAYNCSDISIDCTDNSGTDESGWVTYCDDDGLGAADGSWEAPHSISNLNYNQNAAIWRQLIVPALTDAAYKIDLVHQLTCDIAEYSA